MSEAPHLLIIEAPYYRQISDELGKGAAAALDAAGATYDRLEVPGAFEIPAAIRMNIKAMELVGGRRRYDGYIALGCVIRGETPHFDFVAGPCAEALMKLQSCESPSTSLQQPPIIFGVLTTDDRAQALARSGGDRGHKGRDCAESAIEMAQLLKKIRSSK